MTDEQKSPKPGQRARLTIEEATWDDPWWVYAGSDGKRWYVNGDAPGLSWEPLPDIPVEDRDALCVDDDGHIWSWDPVTRFWGSEGLGIGRVDWPTMVANFGPLIKYVKADE